ncbi:MAG: PASTA domain-containing protein [Solirubrobacterales bacterium]
MERLKGAWPLLVATLLLAAIGATIVADQAHAQICNPLCLPPPDEAPEEEAPPEEGPSPTPTPGPAPHRVLVVNVGWGTGSSENDAPLQTGKLTEYVDYFNGFVNSWFAQSAPPGTFPGWQATAGGSYTIPQPNIPLPSCTQEAQESFWASLLNAVYAKLDGAGIDWTRYNLLNVVYSKDFCNLGVSLSRERSPLKVVPPRVLISDRRALLHELGHYLGLAVGEHPALLHCRDDLKPVTLNDNCIIEENGDPFEIMSNGLGLSFNAIYAKQLGWLNGQFVDMRAPETGMRLIKPFIGSGFSGQRAIRLQDGPTTLWIEYRRPIGIDGPPNSVLQEFDAGGTGVFLRREVSGQFGPVSQLLDMTPSTSDLPSLRVGRTWANPLGEATITLIGTTSAGAVITIGNRRTATVPNVIGLGPERAAAIIANAGLWSQSFSPVIDQTCSNIGVVAEQEPFPGVKVIPGTEVRLGVGEAPPFPCP